MSESPAHSGRLVLVVDEVPAMVRLVQLELGLQGFRTESVLLDEGVVSAAKKLQPDVIVLGSAVPTPGIFDVLIKLRETVSCPVIFIHGLGNENDDAIALELGASDVVSRPYDPEELALRIKATLG